MFTSIIVVCWDGYYHVRPKMQRKTNYFWVPQVWLKFNIFKVPRSHDIAWTSLHKDPWFHKTCLLVPVLNRNYKSTCIFCIVSMYSPEGNDKHELPAGSGPQMAECCETFGPFGPGSTWKTQEDKQHYGFWTNEMQTSGNQYNWLSNFGFDSHSWLVVVLHC